jgi:hypothetical protein
MNFDVGTLVAGGAAGIVGFAIFVYGKKQQRLPHLITGLALMLYPYFVPGLALTIGIGVALVAGLAFVSWKEIL